MALSNSIPIASEVVIIFIKASSAVIFIFVEASSTSSSFRPNGGHVGTKLPPTINVELLFIGGGNM
jgi:hypothetical protein